MLLNKRIHAGSPRKLSDFLNGGDTQAFAGKNVTTAAGSPNISVPVAAGDVPDFTGVLVGDRVHISGEASATVFKVATGTDAQNLILDTNVVAAHVADGKVRILRGGLDSFADAKLIIEDPNAGGWIVVFERDDFFV